MKKKTESNIIKEIIEYLNVINKKSSSIIEFVRFKYPYSNREDLILNKNLIILKCSIHGEFEFHYRSINKTQTPCKLCRLEEKRLIFQEKFIQEANKLFNSFYDYSLVNYEKASKKVCIICPEHGEFWQTPNSHLMGCGCPICSSKTKYFDREKTIELIKKECSIRIKNKISQTFIKVIDSEWRFGATKILINCPIHGDYIVTVRDFLENRSFGCQKCSINNHSLDDQREEKFRSLISECEIIFGKDKYDFSKSIYINENTKIEVICNIHKESFFIKPKLLRKGSGCPLCKDIKNLSRGEWRILNYLKSNNIEHLPQYKVDIGIKCKKTSIIKIDFFIKYKERNIWIEFNGEQHYMFCSKFHENLEEYFEQVKRDEAVLKYAKENNIDYLEISYKDLNRVEKILQEYIFNGKNIAKHIIPKNYG